MLEVVPEVIEVHLELVPPPSFEVEVVVLPPNQEFEIVTPPPNVDLEVVVPPTHEVEITIAAARGAQGEGIGPGGLPGQALIKQSAEDFDTSWEFVPGIGSLIPATQQALDAAILEVEDAIEQAVESSETNLTAHVVSPTPHPAYDDMPSLTLLFENGIA